MSKFTLALALSLFSASACLAAEEPVIFSRDAVTIIPKAEEPVEAHAGQTDTEKKGDEKNKPAAKRANIEIAVEIHPESYLYQPSTFLMNPLEGKGALLILLDDPGKAAVKPGKVYSSLDFAFIAPEGDIVQVAPELQLSDLASPLLSKVPAKALLVLSKGDAAKLDIRPGDSVEHPLFTPKPKVLQ